VRETGEAGRRQPGRAGRRQPPPEDATGGSAIVCPFCGSDRTELFSLFGSSSLVSQYYCRACRSAFERVKWGNEPRA